VVLDNPAVKAKFNGLTLPTMARLGPGTIHRPFDRAPHVGGQTDSEQIRNSALFLRAHDGFVARSRSTGTREFASTAVPESPERKKQQEHSSPNSPRMRQAMTHAPGSAGVYVRVNP
jgi:hypothetical protein